MNRFQAIFAIGLLVCLCASNAARESSVAREWTARNGNTVRGDFVRVRGEFVQIRVTSIRVISVPYLSLSDADQEYVREELKKSGDEHLLDFAKGRQSDDGSTAQNGSANGIPGRSRTPTGPVVTTPEGGVSQSGVPQGGGGPGRIGPGKSGGPAGTGPGSFAPPGVNGGDGRFGPAGAPGVGPSGNGPGRIDPAISGVPGRGRSENAPPHANSPIATNPITSGPFTTGPNVTPGKSPMSNRFSPPDNSPASRPRILTGSSPFDAEPTGGNDPFRRSPPQNRPDELTEQEAERAAAVIGTSVIILGLGCFAVSGVVMVGAVVLVVHLSKRKPSGPTYYHYR